MNKVQKGFTLIELLIVIAVLGILAAGILATIDPFEQFKKARDTNARNTVVEVYNAFVRYNANHGDWPWKAGNPTGCADPTGNGVLLSSMQATCIANIIADGELKAGFSSAMQGGNAITTANVTHIVTASSETIAVCFLPDSKTIKQDPNAKFSGNGAVGGCTVGTNCYWCAE